MKRSQKPGFRVVARASRRSERGSVLESVPSVGSVFHESMDDRTRTARIHGMLPNSAPHAFPGFEFRVPRPAGLRISGFGFRISRPAGFRISRFEFRVSRPQGGLKEAMPGMSKPKPAGTGNPAPGDGPQPSRPATPQAGPWGLVHPTKKGGEKP